MIKSARVVSPNAAAAPNVPATQPDADDLTLLLELNSSSDSAPAIRPGHSAVPTGRSPQITSSTTTAATAATVKPARPVAGVTRAPQERFVTASARTSRVMRQAAQPNLKPPAAESPVAEPQLPEVSVRDMSVPGSVAEFQSPPMTVGDYATLDGHTVACQAARCSPLAKLLEERAATICAEGARAHHQADQRASALQANFLRRQAARQRDVAAANALRAYYSWIANREQSAVLAAGFTLQDEQAATQSALIERGVAIADPTEVQRRSLELRDQQVQLDSNDRQLAQALVRLTCCSSDPRAATVEALEIRAADLPCDSLVSFALQHRQDYLAYVELRQHLDQQTARGIVQLLTPLVGGIGRDLLDLNCIEKLWVAVHGSDALNHVSRELRSALEVQRQLIEQTVCEKCQALGLAYQRAAIAEQLLVTWNDRIESLNRLGELGDARGQMLTTARAEQLKARSDLISRQLAAKLAEVDLAEAMGDLAPRCCRGEPWLVIGN